MISFIRNIISPRKICKAVTSYQTRCLSTFLRFKGSDTEKVPNEVPRSVSNRIIPSVSHYKVKNGITTLNNCSTSCGINFEGASKLNPLRKYHKTNKTFVPNMSSSIGSLQRFGDSQESNLHNVSYKVKNYLDRSSSSIAGNISLLDFIHESPLYNILASNFGEPYIASSPIPDEYEQRPCLVWDTPYGFRIMQPSCDRLLYELSDDLLERDRIETDGQNLQSLPRIGVLIGFCDSEDEADVLKRILCNLQASPRLLYEKPILVRKLEDMLSTVAYRHRSSRTGFGVWRLTRGRLSILHNAAEIALVRSDRNTFELCWEHEVFPNCSLQHVYFFANKLLEENSDSKDRKLMKITLPSDLETWIPEETV